MNEKLNRYVDKMFPLVWNTVLRTPEGEAYRRGYDAAMRRAQLDLKDILESDEQQVNFEQIYDGHYNDHDPLE